MNLTNHFLTFTFETVWYETELFHHCLQWQFISKSQISFHESILFVPCKSLSSLAGSMWESYHTVHSVIPSNYLMQWGVGWNWWLSVKTRPLLCLENCAPGTVFFHWLSVRKLAFHANTKTREPHLSGQFKNKRQMSWPGNSKREWKC